LKNEREGGHFDDNMNYVWRKERGEIDAWLADMDEASMEKSIGEAAKALKVFQYFLFTPKHLKVTVAQARPSSSNRSR
jgi:hypothetical protein